jgi:hypothetical protein
LLDCYHHEGVKATHVCQSCGARLCLECRMYYGDSLCNPCAINRYRRLQFNVTKRSKYMFVSFILTTLVYLVLTLFCVRYHLIHFSGNIWNHIEVMAVIGIIPLVVSFGMGGTLYSLAYASSDKKVDNAIQIVVKAILLGIVYAPNEIYYHIKNFITLLKLRKLIGYHPSFHYDSDQLSHS